MRDDRSTNNTSNTTPIKQHAALELAEHGKNAIFRAVAAGQFHLTEALLEIDKTLINTVDGWIKGKQPLMVAAENGHTEITNLLITNGANVNALGWYNDTALMLAAQNGQDETVKRLLELGADANRCNSDGFTALYYAAKSNNSNCVTRLLAATNQSKAKQTLVLLQNALHRGSVNAQQISAIESYLTTQSAEALV